MKIENWKVDEIDIASAENAWNRKKDEEAPGFYLNQYLECKGKSR